MVESMALSLVLTVIIELILAIIVKIKDEKSLSAVIWINCVTNPVVVYLTNLSLLLDNDVITGIILIMLEVAVVFVEGYLFKKNINKEKFRPYMFSAYMNVLSFTMGCVLGKVLV